MHTVAVVAFDGVVPFDLATPLETFARARLADGRPAYRVVTAGAAPAVDAGTFVLQAPHGLEALGSADTVVVPGVDDLDRPTPGAVLDALRGAASAGARIASVCTGAFVLARTGLLDDLRATTHWAAAAELARRHPRVDVDPGVLYVDNGDLLTSAGAAAALDLCLHMVRRDHGASVAAHVARACVMPLERAGGQAQFIAHPPPSPDGASLAPLLAWLDEHAADPLDVAALARRARLSTRTLHRRFQDQTGLAPLQWVHRARVRHAQVLLESSSYSIEDVGRAVGYPAVTTFRERFRAVVGTGPQAYRHAFRSPDATTA